VVSERVGVAYGDGVGILRERLGIRPVDVGAVLVIMIAVEINVVVGGGVGAKPLNAAAYVAGAVLVLPVLLRHKWPLPALIGCAVLLFFYYIFFRRNITPAPLLCLSLYDAAVAGYLAAAIVIPVFYMSVGLFVVDASTHQGLVSLAAEFLPSAVVLGLAIMLGEVMRSRRALAAETAQRLRLADEEREAEAAARVAGERLRIARELHDTVAHSMATITVQAASALHLIDGDAGSRAGPNGRAGGTGGAGGAGGAGPAGIRAALVAIRDTSKSALADMRVTLGQLRGDDADVDAAETRTAGLSRLDSLTEAVRAAGAPVSVTIEGEPAPLPPDVDHAAYRILQESLTNVLRHAGPDASAAICLRYGPGRLAIRVTDDGTGADGERHAGGHGLTGMSERAAAVGGDLSAGPGAGGGFEVTATLPVGTPRAEPPKLPEPSKAKAMEATTAPVEATTAPAEAGVAAPAEGAAPAEEAAGRANGATLASPRAATHP
jgi:signal transduction histidine kinase